MHPRFLLLLAGCMPVLAPVHAATYFDDFNDGEDTAPLWQFVDVAGIGGSKSFPGGNRYQVNGIVAGSLFATPPLSDGIVRVDIVDWFQNYPVGASYGILFRFDPINNSGYALDLDIDGDPNLSLLKLVEEDVVDIREGVTLSLDAAANDYSVEVVMAGNVFTCRIYQKNASGVVLLDELVYTDTNTPFTTGITGLLVTQDVPGSSLIPAFAVFDNFFATDGLVDPPTLDGLQSIDDQLRVTVTADPGHEVLVEKALDAAQPVWERLTVLPPEVGAESRSATDPDPTGVLGLYRASVTADGTVD